METTVTVLVACVVLQFIILTFLLGARSAHSKELRIVYRFMRETNSDLYYKLSKEEDYI